MRLLLGNASSSVAPGATLGHSHARSQIGEQQSEELAGPCQSDQAAVSGGGSLSGNTVACSLLSIVADLDEVSVGVAEVHARDGASGTGPLHGPFLDADATGD